MLDLGEREFAYKNFHARAELILDEWVGEIIETGEELHGRTIEEFEENFQDAVSLYSIWRGFNGDENYDD